MSGNVALTVDIKVGGIDRQMVAVHKNDKQVEYFHQIGGNHVVYVSGYSLANLMDALISAMGYVEKLETAEE